MKNIYTMITCLVFFTGSNYAQSICDSISVDSVSLQSVNQFYVTLDNLSQYGCAYPSLSVTLNANPYLTTTGALSYASWLDYAGGANNGKTLFIIPLSQFTPASSVPLNTLFTGTALLADPNNPNFSCSLPLQFFFGTMSSSGIKDVRNETGLSLFPNPAKENVLVKIEGEPKENIRLRVLNALGEMLSEENFSGSNEIKLNIANLESGIYFVEVLSGNKQNFVKMVKE